MPWAAALPAYAQGRPGRLKVDKIQFSLSLYSFSIFLCIYMSSVKTQLLMLHNIFQVIPANTYKFRNILNIGWGIEYSATCISGPSLSNVCDHDMSRDSILKNCIQIRSKILFNFCQLHVYLKIFWVSHLLHYRDDLPQII